MATSRAVEVLVEWQMQEHFGEDFARIDGDITFSSAMVSYRESYRERAKSMCKALRIAGLLKDKEDGEYQ